jgi:Flp pilus assembly protein CpaB
MIYAGEPVLKAHLPDPDDPTIGTWRQKRLTLLLDDPQNLVYPMSVSADQVGNYIQAGDYVDVVFTLGRVTALEMHYVERGESLFPLSFATESTSTVEVMRPDGPTRILAMPVSKVILSSVHVLKVERDVQRSTSFSSGMGSGQAQPTFFEGDVVRLYVEISTRDVEVLSFAYHNGFINLPARAKPAGVGTCGYFWDDFVQDVLGDRFSDRLEEEE